MEIKKKFTIDVSEFSGSYYPTNKTRNTYTIYNIECV